MLALFWLGVVCIAIAAAAFTSDLAITLWEGWDCKRRADRLEDLEEWRRLLDVPA